MQKNSSQFRMPSSESQAHRRRCGSLPPVEADEAAHLVAAFLATNRVTVCPPRYAAPVEQRCQPTRSGQ
jgi:hypothetical protein